METRPIPGRCPNPCQPPHRHLTGIPSKPPSTQLNTDKPITEIRSTIMMKKKKRSGRRRRRRRRHSRPSSPGANAPNQPLPKKNNQSSFTAAAPRMEVPASGISSPSRRRRPGHRGGRRRRRRTKMPKSADPVPAIPAAAPFRPVAPHTQVGSGRSSVVGALVLCDSVTGCLHCFTVTGDGAFHPAIPVYPVSPGPPTGTTAC